LIHWTLRLRPVHSAAFMRIGSKQLTMDNGQWTMIRY
jgi:hypothetical protein